MTCSVCGEREFYEFDGRRFCEQHGEEHLTAKQKREEEQKELAIKREQQAQQMSKHSAENHKCPMCANAVDVMFDHNGLLSFVVCKRCHAQWPWSSWSNPGWYLSEWDKHGDQRKKWADAQMVKSVFDHEISGSGYARRSSMEWPPGVSIEWGASAPTIRLEYS